ncbi:glutathione hydrolase 7 [Anoplolepis gracilipes]|uniref:glutathione hydrolase 7 n=1 Tax=Anoplolepis gracilipes TaxID=354296 RepID=UPI003BA0A11F
MSYYNTHLTEECPLTKEKSYKYRLCTYCGNGLNFIIVCFVALTFAITTMLVLQILYTENIPQNSLHGIHGAVATDYSNCSQIGTRILRKLGNAVDAAIAATICMTVVAPHKTGLGGGGYIMIHNSKNNIHPIVIDFANNTAKGFFAKAGIRLPALLKGLEFAHILYGNLPWVDIVKPSAKLAREGFVVSKDLVDEVSKNTDYGMIFNGPLNPGDILQLHELANTLDMVAEYGVKVFYNGTLSYKILHSSNLHEDILQELANYKPTLTIAKSSTLHHHAVYYPSHVSLMQTIIEALEGLPILTGNASTIESLALVAETLMHMYSFSHNVQHAKRESYTGVMALDWQDTYVSILSGLSSPLGFGNMTDAGFLLDNIDDNDFFTFIPIIFHYEEGMCGLRGVFGSDDVFLNGQILYNLIVRALNVSAAIEYPRYYFAPGGIMIEHNQRHSIETALQARLYPMISSFPIDDNLLIKSINAIIKKKDLLSSHSDSRGNGIASRF